MNKLHTVLKILETGEPIPEQYYDHPLHNNWRGYRDLHIEPDWVLVYKQIDHTVVLAAATGTHADLFRK